MKSKCIRIRLGMVFLFVLGLVIFLGNITSAATYYIDASKGNDSNSGMNPSSPWRSLPKVNSFAFQPGDFVLFKRGEKWRGQLIPRSGSIFNYITYGDYGEGQKPLFLGSVNMSNPDNWNSAGGNIWTATSSFSELTTIGNELFFNPSFDQDLQGWNFYVNTGAGAEASISRDTSEYDSPPASSKLDIEDSGTSQSQVQLYTTGFSINDNQSYLLRFRAKASQAFTIPSIRLMKTASPYTSYYVESYSTSPLITEEWVNYQVIFYSNVSASDARITFYLGNIPNGTNLFIDSLSLQECDDSNVFDQKLTMDIGNIIFDNEAICGVKVWNESDLSQQGEYWYDDVNELIKLYSTSNPGLYYSNIELAQKRHIVNFGNRQYCIFENLALKYGGAHGFAGSNVSNVIVRGCDISYIGGAGGKTLRYGNGIEFWNGAHDNLVEGNRIWEIYDAAVTNQGNATNKQYNITYRNNIIWNSEYSFELWNRPETSELRNIYFENNTCLNAGSGWGHSQRDNPSGYHATLYYSNAMTSDIFIRNNIFYETTLVGLYLHYMNGSWAEDELVVNHNLWYQSSGLFFRYRNIYYNVNQLQDYIGISGHSVNSIFGADPGFVDAANQDYHLLATSPLINRGANVNRNYDYDGNPVPQGIAHDIGAFEYAGPIDDSSPVITYMKVDEVSVDQAITVNTLSPQISFLIEDEYSTFNVIIKLDGLIVGSVVSDEIQLLTTKNLDELEVGKRVLGLEVSDARGNVTTKSYNLYVPVLLTDDVPPSIDDVLLDGAGVLSKPVIYNATPTMSIMASDSMGLLSLEIIVDGVSEFSKDFTDMKQSYDLDVKFESPLSIAMHEVAIRIYDQNNNLTSQSYSFYVADEDFTEGKKKKVFVGEGYNVLDQVTYEVTGETQLSLEIETSSATLKI